MRLIDADALEMALKVPMMTINGSPYIDYGFVVNSIIAAPAIEQPEIIRCRDCEYWHDVTPANLKGYQYCHAFRDMMPKDGYCHKAQRREVSK